MRHPSVSAHFDEPTANGSGRAVHEANRGYLHASKLAVHTSTLWRTEAASLHLGLILPLVYFQLKSVTSVRNTVTSASSSQCQYFAITLKKCYTPRSWMRVTYVDGQACCNFHGTVQCYRQMLHIAIMLHSYFCTL